MNNLFRLIRYDWPLHFILVFTNWLPDNVIFLRLRGWLAHFFFKKCGKKLGLGRNVTFYEPSQIVFGNFVYIAYGCWMSAKAGIVIEDEVMLGPYTVLASNKHTKLNGSYRFGPSQGSQIVIGKGSWLGSHSTIAKGVKLGKGSVVGANSFVNQSPGEDDIILTGNPALKVAKAR